MGLNLSLELTFPAGDALGPVRRLHAEYAELLAMSAYCEKASDLVSRLARVNTLASHAEDLMEAADAIWLARPSHRRYAAAVRQFAADIMQHWLAAGPRSGQVPAQLRRDIAEVERHGRVLLARARTS